jgi:hypothetical protein
VICAGSKPPAVTRSVELLLLSICKYNSYDLDVCAVCEVPFVSFHRIEIRKSPHICEAPVGKGDESFTLLFTGNCEFTGLAEHTVVDAILIHILVIHVDITVRFIDLRVTLIKYASWAYKSVKREISAKHTLARAVHRSRRDQKYEGGTDFSPSALGRTGGS